MTRLKRSQKALCFIVLVFILKLGGVSCATKPTYLMPSTDGSSNAHGAAYTADGMNFRKPMPNRPDPHPWEFYYKHCSKGGSSFFNSKTDYSCSEPF